MSMKQKAVAFFLFFSIFCSETEDESLTGEQKEIINWSPLIEEMKKHGAITREKEKIFKVVKTGVRSFIGSPYEELVQIELEKRYGVSFVKAIGEPVLKRSENGQLESTSFDALVKAILFCEPNSGRLSECVHINIRNSLADLWKYQTGEALDAITSGHLISRETIPEAFLKQADRIIQYRTYPIIARKKTEEVLDQVAILSRMASNHNTPVSSPTKPQDSYFVMPGFYGHQRSSSSDFSKFDPKCF